MRAASVAVCHVVDGLTLQWRSRTLTVAGNASGAQVSRARAAEDIQKWGWGEERDFPMDVGLLHGSSFPL